MAAVTPSSDLYLLQCPIEIDNKNQINFANTTTQYNYFFGLNKVGNVDFSYQRKDNIIRYPAHIDTIRHFNYCMYRNDNYSNKWFYAFIESMEYQNDGTTWIKIKTDVYQTWQFDLVFKRCFVEREHVNNDAIGAHTLDEGLSIGEPVVNTYGEYSVGGVDADSQRYVAQVTELPQGVTVPTGAAYESRVYNSIPQGTYFVVTDQASQVSKFVRWYDKEGKANSIVALFTAPANMVNTAVYKSGGYNIPDVGNVRLGFLPASFGSQGMGTFTANYPATLNGYAPKNAKMFCYPYSYLMLSNNAGSNVIYHYEDFQTPTAPAFRLQGVLSQGCQIRAFPSNYKRNNNTFGGYDYGINLSKFPIISWSSDYYLNWQAQNGVNQAVQAGANIMRDAGNIAGGIISLSNNQSGHGIAQTVGGAADIVSDVANAMQEQHVAQLTPDQARGNINCADLTYSMNKNTISYSTMSCRYEYAVMIDNYFSMFGYKVNELKVPNLTGRSNWNFVKTKQCNVIGNIPQEDLNEIKSIFDSGITIWHKTAYFMDYSQNNTII